MSNLFLRSITLLAAFILGTVPISAMAANKVILVLDASGSMMGQIAGKAKITVAREVINDILADWNPQTELGLITYGHRKKGDCKDIEQLIPVGKVNQAGFKQAVAGLRPKGKTPLSASVRQAAEQLKYTEDKATVILVSDGKETCGMDPCKLARDLEKSGVDFTVHVVGFDVSEQVEVAQLRCLARNTGGKYLPARNASSLKDALTTAVKEVAAAPLPKAKPKPIKVDANAPGKLRTRAVMVKGGEFVGGTNFTVYTEKPDEFGEPKRKRVNYSGSRNEYTFTLPPGEYVVTAQRGNAYTETDIVLAPGKGMNLVLNLNGASIKTNAVLSEEGEHVGGVNFTVYREKMNDTGDVKRTRVNYSGSRKEHVFTLNEGDYIITATKGNADAEKRITLEAGKSQRVLLDLNAANIKTTAVMAEGKKQTGGVNFTIYRGVPNEFGEIKLQRVNYSGSRNSYVFTLNAGDYFVSAKKGNAEVRQKLTVEAGKAQAVQLNLNAAYLKTTAVMSEGGALVGSTNFTVYKETPDEFGNPKRSRVNYSGSRKEYTFTLPAGEYVVTAKRGDATTWTRVTLEPGAAMGLKLDLSKKQQ